MEGATPAEWRRFLDARQGDEAAARQMLQAHLDWRRAHLPLSPDALMIGRGLPDFVTLLEGHTSRDGVRVLLVLGAMYDATAGSHHEYALALAALFDASLDRNSDEKFMVLVDARGGDGWPNPRPWAILPWVRVLAATLSANYPERLKRLVVCPVPWVASAVWTAASAFLDERTAAKVALLSGPAARTEPLPASLDEYMDTSAVEECEAIRRERIRESAGGKGGAAPTPVMEAAAAQTPPAQTPTAKEAPADDNYGLAELELA